MLWLLHIYTPLCYFSSQNSTIMGEDSKRWNEKSSLSKNTNSSLFLIELTVLTSLLMTFAYPWTYLTISWFNSLTKGLFTRLWTKRKTFRRLITVPRNPNLKIKEHEIPTQLPTGDYFSFNTLCSLQFQRPYLYGGLSAHFFILCLMPKSTPRRELDPCGRLEHIFPVFWSTRQSLPWFLELWIVIFIAHVLPDNITTESLTYSFCWETNCGDLCCIWKVHRRKADRAIGLLTSWPISEIRLTTVVHVKVKQFEFLHISWATVLKNCTSRILLM